MKIAFDGQLLLNEEWTGIAWSAHNLILELLKDPDNTCVPQCFREGRTDKQMERLKEYQKAGCQIECGRHMNHTLYKLLWRFGSVPYRLFFRSKADITQFFNYAVPSGVYGKRVTFFHDMAYRTYPHTVSRQTEIWLRLCMKKSCRHADHIITVSAFSKSEIIKYLKIKEEQITVIPCAVDHSLFRPNYAKEQIQRTCKKYGIKQDYFLYMGTIEPRKNLERLIGAYAKLYSRHRKVPQLVLAGKKAGCVRAFMKKYTDWEWSGRFCLSDMLRRRTARCCCAGQKHFCSHRCTKALECRR